MEGGRVVEIGAPSLAAWLEQGGEDVGEHELAAVRLVAPIPRPPSVRDFYAFERHVQSARAQRGLEMAPEWYKLPVFYFANPAAMRGPEDEISFPPESSAWDYELEAAAVVGAKGGIAGFTIMNDWSARDLQKMEMAVGLGPAKGKDFATSLGPAARDPRRAGRPGSWRWSPGSTARSALGETSGTSTGPGTSSPPTPLGTLDSFRGTCSARGRWGQGASSSTATAVGCDRVTWSSSRSRGLACFGTSSATAARSGQDRDGFDAVRAKLVRPRAIA